jgi:hypothetical protein
VAQNLLIESGAGKSVLSANMVGELQKIDGAIALYFFFRNGDVRTTSSLQMAASITAQLINAIPPGQDRDKVLEILKRAVENGAMYPDKGRNLKKIWTLFVDMLRVYPKRVVILLDGLDECSDPGSVSHHVLLPEIEKVGASFMVTGRPVVHHLFGKEPNVSTIKMDVDDDISKFIREEVAKSPRLKSYAEEIISTVNENSAGMFRYAGTYISFHRKVKFPS